MSINLKLIVKLSLLLKIGRVEGWRAKDIMFLPSETEEQKAYLSLAAV